MDIADSRSELVIAAAQPPCTPYQVEANASEHAAIVRDARARVIAFPEMSLTGYELDAPTIDAGDERLAPIVDACSAVGAVALVGAPTMNGAGEYISVLAVDSEGCRIPYRKMWLSNTEAERFSPGP